MCIVIFTYVATTSELRFAFSSLIGGFCISYFQHSFLFYFVQRDLVVRVYVKKEIVYFPCLYCLAGTCHFSDGKEYTGSWKDGLPHGNGSFSTELF